MRVALVGLVLLAGCAAEPPPAASVRDAGRDAVLVAPTPDAMVFSMVVERPVVQLPPPALPAIEPRPALVPHRAAAESIPAVHGSAIAALAVSQDGRVAVTVDQLGATRLWPALDGTIEPVVVAAGHPAKLAIARDGDHLVVAALDRAGSLEIIAVRPTGAGIWRSPVDETRPFVSVVATLDSFVATTDDQRLALISLDGMPAGHLVPDPGEHVVSIAPMGAQALALISTAGEVHGRWITKQGWAGMTPRLPIAPERAAVSPDLTRVAAQRSRQSGMVVVSLQTGRVLERIGEQDVENPGRFPLGYVSAQQLAYVDDMQIMFAGGAGPSADFADDRDRLDVIAATAGAVVWARGAMLVIVTPTRAKLLGYKMPGFTELRQIDRGAMLTDGGTLVRVDDHFAERERYSIPEGMWNVIPLDAHRALATTSAGRGYDLLALDLDDPDGTKLLVHDAGTLVMYQPATHLYAILGETKVRVGRYDPRTDTFAGPIEVSLAFPGAQLALPEHGAPLVIVDLHANDKQIAITEIRSLDFAAHSFTAGPTRLQKLPEDFGTSAMMLRLGYGPPQRAVHGALVAEVAKGRIVLRDGNAVRWVVPARGIDHVQWSERGALIGSGNGLAHFELSTGALTDAHCGWSFGLWDSGSRFAGFSGTVCDAARE